MCADGLTDGQELLIAHGTGDDNCHYQHTDLLINALVEKDKYFSVLPYPNRTHAIDDGYANTRKHLYESMTRHFLRTIPPTKAVVVAKL